MADTLSKTERSKRMAMISGKNMKPEITVRKLVFRLGYRYRLHDGNLPGKPDLVFKSRKKVIFVNGCFWHRHEKCGMARLPKSRIGFWKAKLEENKKRDKRNQMKLTEMGWKYLVIWECEINNKEHLSEKVQIFLSGDQGDTP